MFTDITIRAEDLASFRQETSHSYEFPEITALFQNMADANRDGTTTLQEAKIFAMEYGSRMERDEKIQGMEVYDVLSTAENYILEGSVQYPIGALDMPTDDAQIAWVESAQTEYQDYLDSQRRQRETEFNSPAEDLGLPQH